MSEERAGETASMHSVNRQFSALNVEDTVGSTASVAEVWPGLVLIFLGDDPLSATQWHAKCTT